MTGSDRATPAGRILVCVPGVPHPSRGASTVLFYHYLEQLKRAGYAVRCLLLLERPSGDEWSPDAFAQAWADPGRCEVEAVFVERPIRFRKVSGELEPVAVDAAVAARARAFAPDLVLCFDPPALAVAGALGVAARRAAWLGDLGFQTIWLHARYDAMERRIAALRLPKAWLVCRRWKAAYRGLLRGLDLVIVASASSVAALRPLGVSSRYLPYPWPVDRPFRSVASGRAAGARPRFLFCGTLSGLGSRSALHNLLDDLYPELVARWGRRGFEIAITGARSLPGWAAAAIRERPELEFLGFVDDLFAVMDRCHAAIVPIDVPVGNRSRIVTAMGYGLLVIAHPNTALGNPELVADETCLLAADAAAFAAAMGRAYEDAATAERIERAARARYERTFEPRVAAAMLQNAIAPLLDAVTGQAVAA